MRSPDRFWLVAGLGLLGVGQPASPETRVSEYLRYRLGTASVSLGPGQTAHDTFNFKRGDRIEFSVGLSPDSVPGIGAIVCPSNEYQKFRSGQGSRFCGGFVKEDAGGSFVYEVIFTGQHVLAIDNSFAAFFGKDITYEAHITTRPDPELRTLFESMLQDAYSSIDKTFEFTPFDMSIEPCGQVNATSANVGGHITLCGELMYEAGRMIDPDVIIGIMFHELGHTLLNLWGLPNWQNEQTADEFAAVLMVLSGGSASAEKYVSYFAKGNSSLEAAMADVENSPHPLSIQRMRNVSDILDQPNEYVRRWLPILYDNMSEGALLGEIESPIKYSNPVLAKQVLDKRR